MKYEHHRKIFPQSFSVSVSEKTLTTPNDDANQANRTGRDAEKGTERGSTESATGMRLLVLSNSYDDYNDDYKDGKIVSMSSIISQWGLAS